MDKEIWKDIKGYEGLYQISNLGRVKSLNYNHTKQEKVLKPKISKTGYSIIHLSKNSNRKYKTIHRLVGETFISNPNNYPLVLHKKAISDGGTNDINNLYWGTNSDNMKDRTRDGHFENPRQGKFGKDNPTCKPIKQYDLNNNFIKEYESITQASMETGIHYSTISQCCKKAKYRKTAGGYIWKYKEKESR